MANANESQRFRQLSSHNDSFEYTQLNLQKRSNTRNWRLYLIRHVILPQRQKRLYVNTIHSMFSSDFAHLCSTNQLNCVITMKVLFVAVHMGFIIYLSFLSLDGEEYKLQ